MSGWGYIAQLRVLVVVIEASNFCSLAEDELPSETGKKGRKREGGGVVEEAPEDTPVNGAVLAGTGLPGGEPPAGGSDVIGSKVESSGEDSYDVSDSEGEAPAGDRGVIDAKGESSGEDSNDVSDSEGEAPDNLADSGESSAESGDTDSSSTDTEDELILGRDLAREVSVAWASDRARLVFMSRSRSQVPLQWAEEGRDVVKGEETGRRLAVCSMDWDKISAQDLFGGWSLARGGGAAWSEWGGGAWPEWVARVVGGAWPGWWVEPGQSRGGGEPGQRGGWSLARVGGGA